MEIQLRKVKRYLSILQHNIYFNVTPIEEIGVFPCDYKTNNIFPELSDFKKFEKNDSFGNAPDSHAWFHFSFKIPENMKNYPIQLFIDTEHNGWDATNPQFIVYINGEMRQGFDTNHRYIFLDNKDFYDIYVYAYTGPKTSSSKFYTGFRNVHDDVLQLTYDLQVPLDELSYLDTNSFEYASVLRYLYEAVSILSLYDVGSDDFFESVKKARAFMTNEFYGNFCKDQNTKVSCIGHTHIDCAWRWTLKQTREKVQRSFSTVLELMDRFPEYKFMSSQCLLYKDLKEEAPEIYERVRKKIKEGRWECEGAMWVEADCNLPSGESLVRQVVYGKRFFKQEFGVDNKILWLPDVFGYSAALPQILRKCGVDWFVTSKISWNDTNQMPYDTFKWQGLDGTQINTYFLTAQDDKGGGTSNFTTYNGNTGAKMISGTYKRYQQKNLSSEALLTFGFGDGGGGPTPEHIEYARRSAKGIPGLPQSKIEFAGDFLSRLEKKIENNPLLPKWVGELYLEFHRGTYTSISKNKRNNRKCEFLYLDAELLSTIAKNLCNNTFPKSALHDGWEIILTNQFHDIIPGSSIKEVYDRSDIDYKKAFDIGNNAVNLAKNTIANSISASAGYVVFNPHSFVRRETVKIDGKTYYCPPIASKGYSCVKPSEFIKDNHIEINGNKVETDCFTVIFDENMLISSIFDKVNDRNVIKAGEKGNQIRIYPDYPDNYDAWEWQAYELNEYKVLTDVSSTEIVCDGVRKGIKIVRPYNNSTITQTLWFYDDIAKIEFDTVADWHERHKMVKAAFPTDINSSTATYEIQFGSTERPTHKNTSWDKAKFEVCGHKYADLSDGGYGVSIINDCKYGHDIHDGVIMLSLFKCATEPNPEADQGTILVNYAICPHAHTLKESDTIPMAYYHNYPLTAVKATGAKSVIPETYSAVSVDKENVICETVKETEDGTDTVLRIYESKNQRCKVNIKVPEKFKKAYLCDMLENEEKELNLVDRVISTEIKSFEILTIKLK